jgi:DNA-directed RNA polymerase specialized sigma24 family protein
MSAEGTTTRDDAEAARDTQPVEERAEEIVERVSGQVARFARRLVARAREEVEDIVAEAQSVRRGQRPPD